MCSHQYGTQCSPVAPCTDQSFRTLHGKRAKTDQIDAELIAHFMVFRPEAGRTLSDVKLQFLRDVLFQTGLAASCHNHVLKAVATHMKQCGKPHKLMIIAIAGGPVTIANAVLKAGLP